VFVRVFCLPRLSTPLVLAHNQFFLIFLRRRLKSQQLQKQLRRVAIVKKQFAVAITGQLCCRGSGCRIMAASMKFILLALFIAVIGVEAKHKYKDADKIILWANKGRRAVDLPSITLHRCLPAKHVPSHLSPLHPSIAVGPFSSPTETYQYYDLPFCQPKEKDNKLLTLGEVVDGNRMVATPYELSFKKDKQRTTLCSKTISGDDLDAFRKAVSKDYYFQFLYDDLPIWGYVGKVEAVKPAAAGASTTAAPAPKLFLFTHFQFDVSYNGERVIEINVSTDPTQVVDISDEIGDQVTAEFTYGVTWKETAVTFDKRMDKYRKYQFLKQHLEIHWFSIINSCVTVLLLTGFLATILMRVLKNDFVKYSIDDEDPEDQEESGWKFVHGDVFRFPPAKSLFCAMVGSGTQLLVLSFCVFALALVGAFYPYNRGAMFTALIVLYALTAGVAGYTSAAYYRQMEGTKWVGNLMLTCVVFCGPLFLVFCFNNSVAWAYGVSLSRSLWMWMWMALRFLKLWRLYRHLPSSCLCCVCTFFFSLANKTRQCTAPTLTLSSPLPK
jgi:hypothetical protein